MSIENPCPMGGASIPEYEYNMRREREERARASSPEQPATTPVGREEIARVLYECEKRRATNADSVICAIAPKASNALAMEPWDDCKEAFLSDADAVLAAFAVPPEQPAAESDWPPQFEMMKLQARSPEGGDWIDIFPAQLYSMAKNGHDVRAIEGQPAADPVTGQKS